MNSPKRARLGQEGRLGRVFLYSAQKKLGGQLWSKAGPASRIPHLGLCKLNRPHEPGGGPEQEVDLNKKKKVVNTSLYPDEVIERLARCFYPAILECFNSEKGQTHCQRKTGRSQRGTPCFTYGPQTAFFG